jgi:hypothetical protein
MTNARHRPLPRRGVGAVTETAQRRSDLRTIPDHAGLLVAFPPAKPPTTAERPSRERRGQVAMTAGRGHPFTQSPKTVRVAPGRVGEGAMNSAPSDPCG